MKALSDLQKENLAEMKQWLKNEVADKRVVYMSECPVETKHIPFRALKGVVNDINQNESIQYVVGGESSQSPISTMVVYQEGIEW